MLRPTSLAVETRIAPINYEVEKYPEKMNLHHYNRSKYGKVKKHINEKYIRTHAFCGLKQCGCFGGEQSAHHLNPSDVVLSKAMKTKHCVIVDSRTLIKFIDIFQENKISNVLIPYSSWKAVKGRNRKVFSKLRDLYESNPENYFVFNNDSFKETTPVVPLSKLDGENVMVAAAAAYLLKHWREHKVVPLMLTSSSADAEAIGKNYKYVTSLLNYANGMEKSNERTLLIQRIKELGKVEEKGGNAPTYRYYMNERELDAAVRSGSVEIGKFSVTYENRNEAYVQVGDNRKVLISGWFNMNRAITGDTVAVFVLPKSQWKAPEGRFRTEEAEADKEQITEKDVMEANAVQKGKLAANVVPTGHVVSIITRPLKHYCGILEPPDVKNGSRCIFRPADRRIPAVRIDTRAYQSAVGKKVLCSIVRWPGSSWIPHGSLIRVIGGVGDKEAENEVILLEHGVRFREFTADERSELPGAEWAPASPLEPYREDLTHLDICSVDPVGCTDIDDALHFREVRPGLFEVGVHIADVSHFVRAQSPLDLEASRRCTTVYLCGRRIDMLPERLSSNLCSLRENEPRYAFSCIWELDENAEIQNTRFTKSLIRSRRAFTYEQAQELHDSADNSVLAMSIRGLMRLSRIIRERRRMRGSLTLASMEIRFDFDEKTGDPIGVSQKKIVDTMSMIEEFMLLANVSVAERILRDYPNAAMLRRHPTPAQEAFLPLVQAGLDLGFEIRVESNQALSESLDKAVDPKNPKTNMMLRMMATRCMTQALYFPAGTITDSEYRHYGLAIPIYTHFTSPIRRYADVIVHRQLATALGIFQRSDMPKMFSQTYLIALSDEMNIRNRMAQRANRASVVLNTQFLLEGKTADDDGFVTQLKENGVLIVVPKFGVDSIVEFPPNCTVQLKLFQKVRVRLSVVERNQRRFLNMDVIKPDLSGAAGEADALELTTC